MTNQFEFEDNQDISKMDAEQKIAFLKSYISGRDSQNGRFLKGHSGNYGGRPPARRTLIACLNKSFSQKTKVKINGKMVSVTYLQLACDMVVQSSLAERDVKTIMKLLKDFGSTINLSEELPPTKIKPLKEDPTVEMIRKAIINQVDKEFGINNTDDENSSDS